MALVLVSHQKEVPALLGELLNNPVLHQRSVLCLVHVDMAVNRVVLRQKRRVLPEHVIGEHQHVVIVHQMVFLFIGFIGMIEAREIASLDLNPFDLPIIRQPVFTKPDPVDQIIKPVPLEEPRSLQLTVEPPHCI